MWAWIKKWWKWIVFPIGILAAIGGWLLWWLGRDSEPDDDTSSTTDAAADQVVEDLEKAERERELRVKAVEAKHKEKLGALSEDQQKEYEEVRKRPVEEVAKWIDDL